MHLTKTAISCGVLQMYGVCGHAITPFHCVQSLANEAKGGYIKSAQGIYSTSNPAHVIFSDRRVSEQSGGDGGTGLAKFITDNNLGVITESPGAINLNTGAEIVVWVWTPNWEEVMKYVTV